MPETVLLELTEDDVTWFASKISGAAGVLGAEVMELRNWILLFGCALEELRVAFARLDYWMDNPPPPPRGQPIAH